MFIYRSLVCHNRVPCLLANPNWIHAMPEGRRKREIERCFFAISSQLKLDRVIFTRPLIVDVTSNREQRIRTRFTHSRKSILLAFVIRVAERMKQTEASRNEPPFRLGRATYLILSPPCCLIYGLILSMS